MTMRVRSPNFPLPPKSRSRPSQKKWPRIRRRRPSRRQQPKVLGRGGLSGGRAISSLLALLTRSATRFGAAADGSGLEAPHPSRKPRQADGAPRPPARLLHKRRALAPACIGGPDQVVTEDWTRGQPWGPPSHESGTLNTDRARMRDGNGSSPPLP
jgi:hypothetical protein